ncbi:hypothetical protein Ahu01nite_072140 [Winogradskya humida]|uniref:Uncharacterized protein n=1 Tax=Winogradskya humida TaxID=113566 RepID=A0ABQ4A190_9ACTN|nr:hypothetical protein Ahu01nite_072140 [Actinoplanes humidus]
MPASAGSSSAAQPGPCHFNELHRGVEGISHRILTLTPLVESFLVAVTPLTDWALGTAGLSAPAAPGIRPTTPDHRSAG